MFAIVDWTGAEVHAPTAAGTWDPDQLPKVPRARQISLGEVIGGVLLSLFLLAVVPLQYYGMVPFAVLLLGNVALEIGKYAVGAWTLSITAATLLVNAAWVAYAIAQVSRDDVINPAFVNAVGEPGWDPDTTVLAVVVVVVVVLLWDSVDKIVKHRRLRQGGWPPAAAATP